MAIEILLRGIDNVNPNVPAEFLWQRGDVVMVKGIPHPGWGNKEVFPNFWKITIEGVDILDPEVETWLQSRGFVDENDDWIETARRELRLDVDALPVPVRNDILADGIASIASNRMQGFRDAIVTR